MNSIEFRKKLLRSIDQIGKRTSNASGRGLAERDAQQDKIRVMVEEIDEFAKPTSAGIGAVGEATLRAARGGKL